MERFCEFVSVVCGALVAALLTVLTLRSLPPETAISDSRLTLLLVGCAVAALLSVVLVQGMLLMLYVLVTRGPSAIGWVDPAECRSFGAWLSHRWRFCGIGGHQEGFRFLGIEVAFHGQLR